MTQDPQSLLDAEEHIMLSRDTAARLAKLTTRRMDYWADTGVVPATVDRRLSPGTRVRLYGLIDMMALMVATELRGRGTSLQHIRQVVVHLRKRGYHSPLSELRFATVGKRVFFQHPDGSWEGSGAPDQVVISEVLDLDVIRRRINDGLARPAADRGTVERRRGVLGNKAVFTGTRVPVATVQRYIEAGRSDGDILAAFPALTVEDVQAARDRVA